VKEEKKNKEPIWYDGILKDLRIASFLDRHLSRDEVGRSGEVMDRLRKKFPKLPILSQNEGTQEDLNRQKLRAVYEYLKGGEVSHFAKDFFENKEEAVIYLEDMRVANWEGAESNEWKEMISSDPVLAGLARESGARWTELEMVLDKLSPEERTAQLKALRVLQQIRGKMHLLKTYPNSKAYWDKYRSILTERLGIKLSDGV